MPSCAQIASLASVNSNARMMLKGLTGSAKAFAIAAVYRQSVKNQLVVMPDKESAAYLCNDIENIFGEQDVKFFKKSVLFFPSSYKHPKNFEKIDNTNVLLRTEVLNKLQTGKKHLIIVPIPMHCWRKWCRKAFLRRTPYA